MNKHRKSSQKNTDKFSEKGSDEKKYDNPAKAQFEDNRSTTTAQRKLKDMASNFSESQKSQSPVSNQNKIIQRQVAAWAASNVAQGTVVYHCTTYAHALNIINNHIQDVQNAWGGGALGSGFYTHRTIQGSINYVPELNRRVVLRFTVANDSNGQAVTPADFAARTGVQAGENPRAGNDFLSNAEDANEIKWHGGANLIFNGFAIIPEDNTFYMNDVELNAALGVTLAGMAGI